MGFWSSFFGHAAANVYTEMKKEEKETQKWNDNLRLTWTYEEEFSNYLKSIGSNAIYVSEVDEPASSVRNKIERYKRKIKEFLNLGGEGKYIYDVEELDDYIEVIKYLKSVGYVNQQQEFLGLDLFLVKDEIERAVREDNSSASLVNLKGNILNGIVTKGNDLFIPYDDWEESTNTIKVGTAKLYSEDTVQFLEYKTISLVFTETNIYIYSYELDEHSQLYCNVMIGKNRKLDIASLPIPAVEGWSMVVIDALQILCTNSEAEKVMELYRKHNSMLRINAIDSNGGRVYDVQIWDTEKQNFLSGKYVIKFDHENCEILSDEGSVKEITIPKNFCIDVSLANVNVDENRRIVHFLDNCFVMDTEDAIKFKDYYDNYDNKMVVINSQNSEENFSYIADDINQLSGVEFEKVCQQLVEKMGFETETTKASGDGGIDLIAYNHQPLLSGKYIIQCKRYSGSVGEPIIRDLYGVVMSERANKGILMTTGYFTKSAIGFADGKPIELIDGVAMQNLLSEYGLSASKYCDYYCNNTNENRKFYDKAWTEYKNAYYLFDKCLIELKETSIWQESQERHDDVLFAFKVYEIFMMAVSIKEDIQFEMFCQMLDVENVSGIGNRQQYFTQLVTNEGGLREALKEAVLPYGNSPVGIFWNMIATISNEMYDYTFLSKLLGYHVEYVKKLGIALQYYVEKDDRINVLRKNTIEYYEETQKIMKAYISSKQEGLL